MKKLIALTLVSGAAASALAVPSPASAATREFEGTVVSVNRSARTFRLDDSERGVKRIRVVSSTSFERVTFKSLRKGAKNIEVDARRSNGRWVAVSVEKSGGGGSHGDDDDGGHGDDD